MNFFFELYPLRVLPAHYRKVSNRYSGEVLFENSEKGEMHFEEGVFVVEDVPGYFDVEEASLTKKISKWCIKQYPGFLINLEGVPNLADYLNSRFGKSSRYKLRREQKKLEKCFDVRYEMYHGKISKEEYELIFDELYRLLEIRSQEKGIKNNINLSQRDFYQEIVYPMILEKKASLFVIYNGKKPIDICVNFHLNNVIFQYIRTYDIAYSKFNTGYTDLMKQIEWCIANNIKIIVFSKGDFFWKRRWCNTVYDYNYHIFFKSKSLKAKLTALIFWSKRKLRQVLREKKVIERYHAFRNKEIKSDSDSSGFEISEVDMASNLHNLEKIDYTEPAYSFLRRSVYEFIYNTEDMETGISSYRFVDKPNSYLIVGKSKQILITKV